MHQQVIKVQRLEVHKSMSDPTREKHVILPLKTNKSRHPPPNKTFKHNKVHRGIDITFINVRRVSFFASLGSFLLVTSGGSSFLASFLLLCWSFSGRSLSGCGGFFFGFGRHLESRCRCVVSVFDECT